MDDIEGEPSARRSSRLRLGALVATVTAAVALVAVAVGGRDTGRRIRPAARFELHAWAPYWALDVSGAELSAPGGPGAVLGEISPFWLAATSADTITPDPNAPSQATATFLERARRSGARVVPSVIDAMPAGGMAGVLADPAQRTRHVRALLDVAAKLRVDGLDLDYEQFAFADDRGTWPATRPNWIAFLGELAAGLHAAHRTLTVSVPPVYDAGQGEGSGYWVYDYASMAQTVDHIRVMAYDYSTSAPGPIAPLEWVRQAIRGTSQAAGDPEKLVLGIPQYGYNWPGSTSGVCAPGQFPGRTTVTMRNLPGLLSTRRATAVHDPVADEWTFTYTLDADPPTSASSAAPVPAYGDAPTGPVAACAEQREVHYVDASGALERARLARDAGFGGVSVWALGYEDPALWSGLVALGPTGPSGG